MAETAVDIVARQLSVSTADATDLLREIARDLRTQATRKGSAAVEGLGTFFFSDTTFDFKPEEALLNAVGAAQHNLAPLTVVTAAKKPPAVLEERHSVLQAAPEAAAANEPRQMPPASVPLADSEMPANEAPASLKTERRALQERKKLAATSRSPHGPRHAPQQAKRRRVRWLAGVTGILIITFAVTWMLRTTLFDRNRDMPRIAAETADSTVDTATPNGTSPTASGGRTDHSFTALVPADSGLAAENQAVDTPAGLAPATGIDRALGGYTLIVASFTDQAVAAREADRVRSMMPESSVPIDLLQSHDRQWYRVAVGQLPTIDATLALRAQLSMLPPDAWVLRITANL